MREYRIKQTKLGYRIFKVKDEQFLFWTGKLRSYRKDRSKTYITQDDAISALVLSKRQEGIEDFWKS